MTDETLGQGLVALHQEILGRMEGCFDPDGHSDDERESLNSEDEAAVSQCLENLQTYHHPLPCAWANGD